MPPDEHAPTADDMRIARWLLLAALAAGAALRGWLALTDDGHLLAGRDLPVARAGAPLVFGTGWVPLEFLEGLRTWALPGLVAGLLEVFRGLGLSRPALYVPAAKLVFAAVGVATAWATARLARRMGAGPLESAAAGALLGARGAGHLLRSARACPRRSRRCR